LEIADRSFYDRSVLCDKSSNGTCVWFGKHPNSLDDFLDTMVRDKQLLAVTTTFCPADRHQKGNSFSPLYQVAALILQRLTGSVWG
jgi:hypothetical protein